MFGRFSSWLACAVLRLSSLSENDRTKLSRVVMKELGALPMKEVFETIDGVLHVKGQPADIETAKRLRNSARGLTNSYALNLIHDQAIFEAIKLGVHTAETERQMIFARGA